MHRVLATSAGPMILEFFSMINGTLCGYAKSRRARRDDYFEAKVS